MKKPILHYCFTVLLLYFGGVQEASAQFVLASNFQKNETQKPGQESANSVIQLLNKLEVIHKVNFVYQRDLIEGKTVTVPVNENEKLETILKRVLPPMNLRFKKLKGGGYTILPVKNTKAITAEIQQLNPPTAPKI